MGNRAPRPACPSSTFVPQPVEPHPSRAVGASCPRWQKPVLFALGAEWPRTPEPRSSMTPRVRVQEEEPSRQAVSLDCSSPEGPQGIEDQGLRNCQEGHSTLQEGQGALCPVSAMTNFKDLRSTSSRRGDFYVCRAPEPRF